MAERSGVKMCWTVHLHDAAVERQVTVESDIK